MDPGFHAIDHCKPAMSLCKRAMCLCKRFLELSNARCDFVSDFWIIAPREVISYAFFGFLQRAMCFRTCFLGLCKLQSDFAAYIDEIANTRRIGKRFWGKFLPIQQVISIKKTSPVKGKLCIF
jgi:hypothetical protein